MKEEDYVDLICRRFCRYYKGGREDVRCGTFSFLRRNLTSVELRALIGPARASGMAGAATYSKDAEVKGLACDDCDFLVDGCDFRDNSSGPPCGGYAVMEMLLG